ncbi:MAG TPA: hypothetical protein VEL76_08070, partial [Gemmataceae bacterium]|nr:hypothetical protein [Gemmataceae bacterium]
KQLWERRGLKVVDVAERHRQTMLNILDAELTREEARLKALREGRAAKVREMAALNVENLMEQRRITDVKAKLTHLLADCDLLVVPRFTFYNLARRDYIPAWRHGLEPEQVEAVKEFLKAGKPVLFCLGPANDDPDPRARRPPDVKPDALEPILADLGFKLPVQTVLYDAQAQAPTDRRASFLGRPGEVILPPVNFDWPAGTGRPPGVKGLAEGVPHPIRTSLRLNLGERGADPELRLRYPRPVYFEAPSGSRSKVDPVFLMSGPDSWNEKEPFPTGKRTPRFEAPKLGDPERGTLSEKRRGPLPIAAAAEVKVPAAWYADPKQAKERPTVRVAVIGQGTLLAGDSLSPAREKLVFDVANWLLGRDDSLSQDTQRWAYPRVSLKEQAIGLWRWGTLLGMPLLFIYFGCAMWMVRRLR